MSKKEVKTEQKKPKVKNAKTCPNDNDGDGNRGKRICPACNPTGEVKTPDKKDSTFLLVKRCHDGRCININFGSEAELREHLVAMWENTPGYSVVAVVTMPNAGLEPRGNRVGSEPLLADGGMNENA